MKTTKAELQQYAAICGLHIAEWSPGDGVTRYRFFTEQSDYFAGRALDTCLGASMANEWLNGYRACQERSAK